MGTESASELILLMNEHSPVLLLTFCLCLAGGYLRGLTGFGGVAVVLVSLSLFHDAHTAIAMAMLIDLAGNIKLIPTAFSHVAIDRLRAMLIGSAVGLPCGALVLLLGDQGSLAIVINGTIILVAFAFLLGLKFERQLDPRKMLIASIPIGAIMGATSIAIPMALLLLSSRDSARGNRANFIIWVFFANIFVLIVAFLGGDVQMGEIWQVCLLAPAYVIGTILGIRAVGVLGDLALRRVIASSLLALGGLGLLANTLSIKL